MNALIVMVVLSSSVTAATPCFTTDDVTPGWKAVHLPKNAPSLAAPEDVPQFRGGESAVVTYVDREVPLYTTESAPGRVRFDFTLPQGARHARVEFVDDLHGAKVDVSLSAGGRTLPLVRERRMSGKTLSLDWDFDEGSTLTVVVHHHARGEPVVARWQIVSETDPAQLRDLPAPFRELRVLYYLQPAGRVIELCNAPDRRLAVDHAQLRGDPTHVALSRR